MKGAAPKPKEDTSAKFATVSRGPLQVKVVETGTIDAAKTVEVKGRVSGRLARLLVKEGDMVQKGQLIAVVDPQETELTVEQNRARLRGAQTGVDRAAIEIAQRRISAKAAYDQAVARKEQLRVELSAQPTLTRVAITQAKADLEGLFRERDRLLKNGQPNSRTAGQSSVDEAQSNYDNVKLEYDRTVELAAKGYVAGRDVDNAKLQLELASTRLRSAKDQYARLESSLTAELAKVNEQIRNAQAALVRANANSVQDRVKVEEYNSALAAVSQAGAALRDVEVLGKQREESRATVDQIRSVLSDSERQLRETEIRAPMSGIVTKKLIEEGELVTGLSTFSSGTSIVRIEDRSSMRVMLDVNEIDVARMTLGMKAEVEVDALPSEKLQGAVMKIAPSSKASGTATAAASSGTDAVVKYEVEILVTSAPGALRSGMSAKCSFFVVDRKDVLQLPAEFVGQEGDKHFVDLALPETAKPEAKPERKTVTIGSASGSVTEITSGVNVGDKVQRPEFKGPARKGAMDFGGGG